MREDLSPPFCPTVCPPEPQGEVWLLELRSLLKPAVVPGGRPWGSIIATRVDPVVTCHNRCGERQLWGRHLEGLPLGELGRRGLGESSSRGCLPGAASPEPRGSRSRRGAGGRSLGGQPGASSVGSKLGRPDRRGRGAETRQFFWELAGAGGGGGVEGGGSEKPAKPGALSEGCGGGEGNWSSRPGPGRGTTRRGTVGGGSGDHDRRKEGQGEGAGCRLTPAAAGRPGRARSRLGWPGRPEWTAANVARAREHFGYLILPALSPECSGPRVSPQIGAGWAAWTRKGGPLAPHLPHSRAALPSAKIPRAAGPGRREVTRSPGTAGRRAPGAAQRACAVLRCVFSEPGPPSA